MNNTIGNYCENATGMQSGIGGMFYLYLLGLCNIYPGFPQ